MAIGRTIATCLGAALLSSAPLPAAPPEQMVLSIAPEWNSSEGRLQLFERDGRRWQPVGAPFRVLYGKNGLAWGRGVKGTGEAGDVRKPGTGEAGPQKAEGDKRAPAGVFEIGTIYTFDRALPEGAQYPFHTIGLWDAWIDDPANPLYNQHVVVDAANPPAWFEKQKMRHNDPPHRWLVEIRHNADPPVAGAGSAIFFHIQRGPGRTSAGCTVMPSSSLVKLITWLRKSKNPHYALLPRAEYLARWKAWDLPSPEAAAGVLAP